MKLINKAHYMKKNTIYQNNTFSFKTYVCYIRRGAGVTIALIFEMFFPTNIAFHHIAVCPTPSAIEFWRRSIRWQAAAAASIVDRTLVQHYWYHRKGMNMVKVDEWYLLLIVALPFQNVDHIGKVYSWPIFEYYQRTFFFYQRWYTVRQYRKL